jgi:hypothetical protein
MIIEPTSYGSKQKYKAIFQMDNGKTKTVRFGARGYEDYTTHHDKARRAAYRKRHAHDNLDDPTTPGSLSYYLLWGESTSLNENIKLFKQKFNL